MALFDDPTRLKTLARLVPDARAAFSALIAEAEARGFLPFIVSAVRNCAEQGNLALTKADRSWHVFGRAVDIELHLGAPKDDPAKFYRELAEWWESKGGVWGGRWTELYPQAPGVPGASGDVLHFQWTPGLPVGPPQTLWPKGAACDVVQANADAYLAAGGRWPGLPTPPLVAPSSPALPPGVIVENVDVKKKGVAVGLWFFCWGLQLSAATSWRPATADVGRWVDP